MLLAASAALRLHGLAAGSLWADEGNSWAMAVRPLAAIAPAAAADIHPPLYYYLLHFWARLFSTSEAGLRSLSVLAGCALVALSYAWAAQIAGFGAGIAAGVLAALSPFAIYYSQEARSYILLAGLGLGSSMAWSACVSSAPQARRLGLAELAWLGLTAACLWTHYLGSLVVCLQGLFVLGIAVCRRSGRSALLARWALLWLLLFVLYAPWLKASARSLAAWPAIAPQFGLGFFLKELGRLYTGGPTVQLPAPFALLCFLPLLALPLRPGRTTVWLPLFAVAGLLWPAVSLWVASLLRPAYREKFLLLGLPYYHVALGCAVAWAARAAKRLSGSSAAALCATVLLLAPLLASLQGLLRYYEAQPRLRDDYRGIAAYIAAVATEQDAVILNAPGQQEVFAYYYHGAAPVYPLPRQRPPEKQPLASELAQLAARHECIFAVFWGTPESDPEGLIENWLDSHLYKALDEWYGNVRLTLYTAPKSMPAPKQVDAPFGGSILLRSYAVSGEPVQPGLAVPVRIEWQAIRRPELRYKLFLQALDAQNNIVGQRDSEPLSAGPATDAWQPGVTLVGQQAIPIFLGTPPGSYRLIAGLYDPQTGERLRLPGGEDHIELGEVRVLPNPRPIPDAAVRSVYKRDLPLGPLRLVGWDVARLGSQPSPAPALPAGTPLSAVLYWRVAVPEPLQVELVLEGAGRRSVLNTTTLDAASLELGPEALLRVPIAAFLPADLPAGRYRLLLHVQAAQGDGWVDLAPLQVTG